MASRPMRALTLLCVASLVLLAGTDLARAQAPSPDDARDLELGRTDGLHCDDEDWYRVRVEPGTGLLVRMRVPRFREGDLDIRVLDDAGQELGRSVRTSGLERVAVQPETDEVLVHVYGYEGASNDYSLDLRAVDVTDDDLEPNDTPETPRALEAGRHDDLVVFDDDWYRIDAPRGAEVTARLSFRHDAGDVDLEVYTGDLDEIVDRSASTDDGEELAVTVPGDDGLLLRVYLFDGESNRYDLTLEGFGDEDGPAPDPDEAPDPFEPNDELAEAAVLKPGTHRAIPCTDDDWYLVEAEAGRRVAVRCSFPHDEGDIDLDVTDGEGEVLARSNGTEDREECEVAVPEDGRLYVRVYGYSGATNVYDLTVELPGAREDDHEENDYLAEAAPLPLGRTDDLYCADPDWFEVEAPAEAEVEVIVRHSHAEGDLDLEVLDRYGALLGESASATDGEEVVCEVPPEGRIVIRVYGYEGARAAYSLEVRETARKTADRKPRRTGPKQDDPEDDRFEENDEREEAATLETGHHPDLLCADDDWYWIDLSSGVQARIRIAFDHDEGDIDLQVEDRAGDVVATSNGIVDEEEVTVTGSEEGLWVRVYGYEGASNSYDLTYEMAVPGDDLLEMSDPERGVENDRRDAATPVEPGTHSDLIVQSNDSDWYRVEVPAGTRVTVRLSFVHERGDVDMEMQGADGSHLGSSTGVSDAEEIEATAPEGGVYVRVYGFSGAANEYEMTVETGNAPAPPEDPPDGEGVDPHEPNQDLSQAAGIEPGRHEGLVCDEDDWYRFRATPGTEVVCSIEFEHDDGDLDIEAVDADGTRLASSAGMDDDERIAFPAPADGWVHLHVYVFGGGRNAYELAIEADQEGPFPEDDDEGNAGDVEVPDGDDRFEENDEMAAPAPLEPGTHEGLVAADPDWYRVEVPAGEQLTVRLAFEHDEGDLDLEVRGPDDAVLGRSTGVEDAEVVRVAPPGGGDVYVHVWTAGDPTGSSYDLTVELEGGDAGDDRFEENDTRSEAAPVEPGTHEGLHCGDDDWYRVSVEEPSAVTVAVTFPHERGDIDMEVTDAEGSVLEASNGTDDREEVVLGRVEDEVWIHVYGFGGAVNDYDLIVELGEPEGPPAGEDDRFEENDVPEEAALLEPGTYEDLLSLDDDWYRIEAEPGSSLTLRVTFEHDDGDIDVEARTPEGSRLGSSVGTDDEEELEVEVGPEGAVLVRVYGFAGAENAYDLVVEVGEPGPDDPERPEGPDGPEAPPEDDRFEENDEAGQAAPLRPGRHEDLRVEDDDWYRIEARPGATIQVRLEFEDARGDVDVAARGTAGQDLGSSAGTSDSEEMAIAVPEDGVVLVRVYGFAGATNDYAIEVTGPDGAFPPTEDDLEENDDRSSATPVEPGTIEDLVLADEDWYRFEGPAGDTFHVDVGEAAEACELEVTGPDGEPLEAAPTERGAIGQIPEGGVWIRLRPTGDEPVRYDMEISIWDSF